MFTRIYQPIVFISLATIFIQSHANASTAVSLPEYGTIVSKQSEAKCLNIRYGSLNDGGEAIQYTCGIHNNNDKFSFVNTGQGYLIKAKHSGKCLAVEDSSMTSLARIIQLSCSIELNQLWTIEGQFNQQRIKSVLSGLCMDVEGGLGWNNGAKIIQYTCHDDTNQQWKINAYQPTTIKPLYGVITSKKVPDKCVKVIRGSAKSVTCDGQPNEKFKLIDKGNAYQLKVQDSGKCLGVENSSINAGKLIVPLSCRDESNQLWRISGEGEYKILKLQHSGYCLDIYGGSTYSGAKLIQWPCHGASNQQWKIEANTLQRKPRFGKIVATQLGGKCINIPQGSSDDGANAYQYSCTNEFSQEFSFSATEGGYFIHTKHNGKCLTVEENSQSPEAWIIQDVCNTDYAQIWQIAGQGDNTTIKAVHSGMCLAVAEGNLQDHTPIVQTQCDDSAKTKWRIDAELSRQTVPSIWQGPYEMPMVFAAAANLPSGEILGWAAWRKMDFGGSHGKTYTTIFDPDTGATTEGLVINTQHDMFCPGTAMLADGKIMITGGSNAEVTTIYDPETNQWQRGQDMVLPRGYHAMTPLSDGSVFTVGGSWSGGMGYKNGEIWDFSTGEWKLLPQAKINKLMTNDAAGVYRADNHIWMFTAPNGQVFQAGPSKMMNWIDVLNQGAVVSEKLRADDNDAMNGNAVMYDIGKILTLGGARNYNSGLASKRAYVIDINGGIGNVTVERVADMSHERAFHNSVVLPSGEVVVIGGHQDIIVFSDQTSVFTAEIWDPKTQLFTELGDMLTPRNYHSIALLQKDGRVFVAGGGLCGDCATNHADAEILTPPYLLNNNGTPATRPVIEQAPTSAIHGQTIRVEMDSADDYKFVLVRTAAATHAVNNDERRIPLLAMHVGNGVYEIEIPVQASVAVPGNYFLFAMNRHGVPSIAKVINIPVS